LWWFFRDGWLSWKWSWGSDGIIYFRGGHHLNSRHENRSRRLTPIEILFSWRPIREGTSMRVSHHILFSYRFWLFLWVFPALIKFPFSGSNYVLKVVHTYESIKYKLVYCWVQAVQPAAYHWELMMMEWCALALASFPSLPLTASRRAQ
jgi:hypothetical protein